MISEDNIKEVTIGVIGTLSVIACLDIFCIMNNKPITHLIRCLVKWVIIFIICIVASTLLIEYGKYII